MRDDEGAMPRIVLALLLVAGSAAGQEGFTDLFDGSTLNGWHVEPRKNATGAWLVEGQVLAVKGRPGNLVSESEFGDFDLRLEWKVGALGNSGVFYRVQGSGNPAASAVEYQLADNARDASQSDPKRRAGAAYGLFAPSADAARPPGLWNSLRIVARGSRVEHWLNGRKVVDYDAAGPDFSKRAEAAGRKAGFGQAQRGRIVLQDHNSEVRFRNLRIQRLD